MCGIAGEAESCKSQLFGCTSLETAAIAEAGTYFRIAHYPHAPVYVINWGMERFGRRLPQQRHAELTGVRCSRGMDEEVPVESQVASSPSLEPIASPPRQE